MVRTIKFHKSAEPTATFSTDIAETTLAELNGANTVSTSRMDSVTIAGAERPSNYEFRVTNMTQYWYSYALMDWYRSEVSVLSTLIFRVALELFRYGLILVPKFAYKCEDCGYESQNIISRCPRCGGARLREPDESQKDYFKRPNGKSFLDEANNNGQSLTDVLRSYAEMELQNNQAYTLCVTGEFIRKSDGKLLKNYPLEFVSWDPKYVRYLYDDTGRPGTTYAFTRDNRHVLINLDNDPNTATIYSREGKELVPAVWQIGQNYGATGEYWVYSADEVYQDHWMRPSMTYGVPTWFDIEDDLLAYHYMEKQDLKKYKLGYVRKILILPGFNDEDAESIAKGVTDVLKTNNNSIPIVCTPPQLPGVAKMDAQVLDLTSDTAQDNITQKNEIRDRICAHGGAPNLFMGDVQQSGGMNSEAQQVTIFDRYLTAYYNLIDRQCRWIMGWFPLITDWELIVDRPSKSYASTKKWMDNIQIMQSMKSMGFAVECLDGNFRYSSVPLDQLQMISQLQQSGVDDPFNATVKAPSYGNGPSQREGGLLPGDGYGPPEKGTLRREDGEVAGSKDEVDLAKRETKDSVEI